MKKTLSIFILSLTFCTTSAFGATFTVDTTDDTVDANIGDGNCADASGNCSLRAAIQEANSTAAADTITVPSGTFLLSLNGAGEDLAATGDLDITNPVTVSGDGAASTIINPLNQDRAFDIVSDTSVTFQDIGFTSGSASGNGGAINGDAVTSATLTLTNLDFTFNVSTNLGGAVNTLGPIIVTNSTFNQNFAQGGGAIRQGGASSSMTVTSSTFSNNSVDGHGEGGAICYNGSGGAISITGSTFSKNSSSSRGGDIAASNAPTGLTISNSTFSNARAENDGGAIYYGSSDTGDVNISNSTVESASADGSGGGIYLSTSATNCNFTNVTVKSSNANGNGGGIYSICSGSGTTSVQNSTLDGNTATSSGGGIYQPTGGSDYDNSVFSNNIAQGDGGGAHIFSTAMSDFDALTFQDNTVVGSGHNGAGMYLSNVSGAALSVSSSSFFGNRNAQEGGGLYFDTNGEVTTVDHSSFFNNQSGTLNSRGGGLFLNSGPAAGSEILNTTFSGNTITDIGGGLFVDGGTLDINSSTFVGNIAPNGGGAIINDSATITANNTIFANCVAVSGNNNCDGNAPVTSADYNVDDEGDCNFAQTNDLQTDPGLAAASTKTNASGVTTHAHVPNDGSPVVDSGDATNCPATDQIGTTRPLDGGTGSVVCDRGAIERIDDECPDDDNKTEAGVCGCGVPDVDADGNGILDCLVNDALDKLLVDLEEAISPLKKPGAQRKRVRREHKANIRNARDAVQAFVAGNNINIVDGELTAVEHETKISRQVKRMLRVRQAQARKFKPRKNRLGNSIDAFQEALV